MIFSITVFGGFFGVFGMIVGVPIFAVIYTGIKYLINVSLKRRNLPQDTEKYLNVGSIDRDGFHEYVPEYKLRRERKMQERAEGKQRGFASKAKTSAKTQNSLNNTKK